MTDQLTVDTGTSVAGPVLHVRGELDLTTVAVLRTAVRAAPLCAGEWLIIDLAVLEFCDSAGMSALIAASNRATAAYAGFALSGVPRHLLTALRVVGLDQVFSRVLDRGSRDSGVPSGRAAAVIAGPLWWEYDGVYSRRP